MVADAFLVGKSVTVTLLAVQALFIGLAGLRRRSRRFFGALPVFVLFSVVVCLPAYSTWRVPMAAAVCLFYGNVLFLAHRNALPLIWNLCFAGISLAWVLFWLSGYSAAVSFSIFTVLFLGFCACFGVVGAAGLVKGVWRRMLLAVAPGFALCVAFDFYLGLSRGPNVDAGLWFVLVAAVCTGIMLLRDVAMSGSLEGLWDDLSDSSMREILFQLDRTEANLQLQERYVTRGYLAAGVVHEFKNILSLITLCAEFGLANSGARAKDKALGAVLSNVDTGSRSVLSMLENLAVSGREKRRAMPLGEIVEPLVHTLKANYRIDEIDFGLDVVQDAVVSIRRSEFEQALLNLIRNSAEAFRALPEADRKQIDLKVYRSGESAVVEVSDNAGGIPADIQRGLFDAPSVLKPGGLGLFLARKTVQENGGQIDYHATQGGSRFRLVFPAS